MKKTKEEGALFMAFAETRDSENERKIRRFIGIDSVRVVAVNPDRLMWNTLFKTSMDDDIEYVKETVLEDPITGQAERIQTARIVFIVEPQAETAKGELLTVNFTLRNQKRISSKKDKVQVIDRFGRMAWIPISDMQNHSIPQYANGPAKLDPDYRPALFGEEELIGFVRRYLNIPSMDVYNIDSRRWEINPCPERCEGRFDRLQDIFRGDFSEITSLIEMRPQNRIKVLFGVRTSEDNRQYQVTYNRLFLSPGTTNYVRLQKEVTESQEKGGWKNTEFIFSDLQEYTIQPTGLDRKPEPAEERKNVSNKWFQ